MIRFSPLLACLSLAASASPTLAQGGENPLGGPSVEETTATEAVETGFDGSVEAPEGTIGVAALKGLELTDGQREAIDAVLAARASLVDSIIVESYDDVLELVNGFQSAAGGAGEQMDGDEVASRRRMMELVVKLRRVMAPLMERGTLEEEIAGVLEGEEREAYESVVDTLHEAAHRRYLEGQGRRAGDRANERGMVESRRRAYVSVLRELGDGLDRVLGQRARDFNERLENSGLPAALQEKIRVWAMEYSAENGMGASQQNPGGAIRSLLASLDREERRAVIQWYQRIAREEMRQ